MLGWFVHGFVKINQLTPNYILVLFIVSVLALAWAFFTLVSYLRARHDALFVAFVDLCFFGALIGGVVVLRDIANSDCVGPVSFERGPGSVGIGLTWNKRCAMLKACWALAIINIIAFFVTFVSPFFPLLSRPHSRGFR
jgi:hypothetical protein